MLSPSLKFCVFRDQTRYGQVWYSGTRLCTENRANYPSMCIIRAYYMLSNITLHRVVSQTIMRIIREVRKQGPNYLGYSVYYPSTNSPVNRFYMFVNGLRTRTLTTRIYPSHTDLNRTPERAYNPGTPL